MDVKERLSGLTSKNNISFFDSGDDAIFFILNHLKTLGLKKVLIPDSGGWFSYRKYPKKLFLEIIEIKTVDSLIDIDDLKNNLAPDSCLLLNSLGGYFVEEPVKAIEDICREKNILFINDVSASIGTHLAKFGDFCIGSFGEDKPIDLGIGGFIGSNIELFSEKSLFEISENFKKLNAALDILHDKLRFWENIREKILRDLDSYPIIHKNSNGINVVARFDNVEQKENLINYCAKYDLEYVLCPNYIKVLRPAVSIEVKRVSYKKDG